MTFDYMLVNSSISNSNGFETLYVIYLRTFHCIFSCQYQSIYFSLGSGCVCWKIYTNVPITMYQWRVPVKIAISLKNIMVIFWQSFCRLLVSKSPGFEKRHIFLITGQKNVFQKSSNTRCLCQWIWEARSDFVWTFIISVK